jgi:hypothetical protein
VVVRLLSAIRKTVAVGCSAILIAGFVSYRAGAFDELFRPNTPAAEPVEQPTPEVVSDAPPDVVLTNPTMFSSSKSIILAPASTPGQSPAVLPGSKSSGVFTPGLDVPVRPAPPAAAPPTPPAQTPPIIGGSKSLAPLIPPAPQKPNSPSAETGPPR